MNLLPFEAREALHKEYRLRFVALLTLFITAAAWIAVIVAVPAMITTFNDYRLAQVQAGGATTYELNNEEKVLAGSFQEFVETLGVIDPDVRTPLPLAADVMRAVIEEQTNAISVHSFTLAASSEAERRFLLSGVALDRESLVSFSRQLSDLGLFSSVELPISNLSKREDIEFSITAVITVPARTTEQTN